MSLFNPSSFNWPSSALAAPSSDAQEPSTHPVTSSPVPDEDNQQPHLEPSSDGDIFEDAEEDQSDRPNKWRGSSEKYKSLIADARQTKDSLDRLDDQDLKAHLFNIHGLKRGLYPDLFDNNHTKTRLEQWKRKERLYEDQGWFPHRSWTAWPVEPGVVPRRDERMLWYRHRNGEVADVKKAFEARLGEAPSQELEDVLLAEFTKQARKKYEAREWDIDRDTESEVEEAQEEPVQNQGKRKRQDNNDAGSDGSRREKPMKTSRQETSATLVNRSGTPLGLDNFDTIYKPIVLADDEVARSKTQPMINSIIDKVDSLLTALHHSRTHQITSIRLRKWTKSRQDQLLPEGEEESRITSPVSIDKNNTHDSDSSATCRTDAYETSRKRRRACRPRDWSEVLGMAAIIGWSPEVLSRTQARCEALFAERMTFHNINSGPYDGSVKAEPVPSATVKEEFLNGVHLDNFMQPIPRYHSSRRYQRRRRAKDSNEPGNDPLTSNVAPEEEEESMECTNCGTNHTTNWRRDPTTKNLLCNPCGVYLHRLGKHRPIEKEPDPIRECAHCKTKSTSSWRRPRLETNAVICKACALKEDAAIKQRENDNNVRGLRDRRGVTCNNCGKPWTKGFRAGPGGPGTLCAACGGYWRRHGKMIPKEEILEKKEKKREALARMKEWQAFRSKAGLAPAASVDA